MATLNNEFRFHRLKASCASAIYSLSIFSRKRGKWDGARRSNTGHSQLRNLSHYFESNHPERVSCFYFPRGLTKRKMLIMNIDEYSNKKSASWDEYVVHFQNPGIFQSNSLRFQYEPYTNSQTEISFSHLAFNQRSTGPNRLGESVNLLPSSQTWPWKSSSFNGLVKKIFPKFSGEHFLKCLFTNYHL